MFLKKYKPYNNSLRDKLLLRLNNYVKFKRLFKKLKKKNGKNYSGQITMKYKGGGVSYLYRSIDNFLYKYNFTYNCIGFDKSLYTSALLALLQSDLNTVKYIIAPHKLNVNKKITTTFIYKNNIDSIGDTLPIGWIPNNTLIYNLENKPFSGTQVIKSAGTYGKIISHTNNYVKILLPSKQKKIYSKFCLASIGRVSNIFSKFQNYGKAGYTRNLNIRPRVSCSSMNPYDHPNGGKTKRGNPIKNFSGKIIK